MLLMDKVAIVTGAGGRIGRVTAVRFAREGARLVLNDIDGRALEETASAVRAEDSEPTTFVGDVARGVDAAALAEAAMAQHGRIDVLDNNAALHCPADSLVLDEEDWLDRDEEDWDRVQLVNVRGTYQCCKHVIPHMAARHAGSIVTIGSIVSFIALDGPKGLAPAYVASKGAVLELTRALAVRHARDSIRVDGVCPGFIETPMVEVALAGMADTA
jgi:NAD(P)-dependent dehydrogenase (short-subunit alcohol dehydrogenase family)